MGPRRSIAVTLGITGQRSAKFSGFFRQIVADKLDLRPKLSGFHYPR